MNTKGTEIKSSRELVIKIRNTNPCLTLRGIGEKVGLSKQRVEQILKKTGKPTKHFKQSYICNNCKKLFIPRSWAKRKLFCCLKCKVDYSKVELICETCGNLFKRSLYYMKSNLKRTGQNHIFCNKRCQGKWLGKEYGIGSDYAKNRDFYYKHQ